MGERVGEVGFSTGDAVYCMVWCYSDNKPEVMRCVLHRTVLCHGDRRGGGAEEGVCDDGHVLYCMVVQRQ